MYPPSGEQFFLEVHERLKQKYTAKMDTNFRSSSLEAVKYSLTNILGLLWRGYCQIGVFDLVYGGRTFGAHFYAKNDTIL